MVSDILEILKLKPGDTVLDATLGYGGHTLEILKRVTPGGHVIGLDQDPLEREKTLARIRAAGFDESSFLLGPVNFSKASSFLKQQGVSRLRSVLADLGLSSMQIDNPERGFTFKADGPLDLRMNPLEGEPAHELLSKISEVELVELLREYSDEPHARQIAKALVQGKPKTTGEFARIVRAVVKEFSPKVREREGDTPIRRALQTLRILVNSEFDVLEAFLDQLPFLLAPQGTVVILSFHSGEDRRVKKSFQSGFRAGIYSEISDEPQRASGEEIRNNPRSKSAKLRWAIRS